MAHVAVDTQVVDLDAADLAAGVVLRKWYLGELIEVAVVLQPGGLRPAEVRRGWWRYRWRGKVWRSLSAIAFEVTGDRYMSGNRFFGLRLRRGRCRKRVSRAMSGWSG